tara:strand:+ start:166 stop:510 length:345 start_codon:yes stop_codon:yes gene_type:complete
MKVLLTVFSFFIAVSFSFACGGPAKKEMVQKIVKKPVLVSSINGINSDCDTVKCSTSKKVIETILTNYDKELKKLNLKYTSKINAKLQAKDVYEIATYSKVQYKQKTQPLAINQ